MTTDTATINQTATHIAQMAFDDDQNPFALQMYFHYMSEEELRGLLNWTDDERKWKPKTYPEDRGHYRLVAECMLRYYYYRFETKEDDIEWEHADGEPDYVVGEKFQKEKEYWSKISINPEAPTFPYAEFEDPQELVHLRAHKSRKNRRPRLFSRDVINK
jgi:hypothetical protein